MLSETATLPISTDWSEGPRALVTGAASGIGEACCRLLLERGYGVFGFDLRRGLADGIEWSLGSVVEPKHCQIAAELSAPHIVIHCAGVSAGTLGLRHSHEMTEEQWQTPLDVNLSGSWRMARACLTEGTVESFVFVSSISGLVSNGPGVVNANYCASKQGVVGLMRALAVEYAPAVRFNAVLPGMTDTPMYRKGLGSHPELEARVLGNVPLGRKLTAAEVARACVDLAENTAAVGSCMVVDGGYSL